MGAREAKKATISSNEHPYFTNADPRPYEQPTSSIWAGQTSPFEDVAGLTEQVKKNIDDPQGSAAVESYLRREPDIEPIADEIFEIIELASRDISAVGAQYKLLGSVSRITGNLVVVERLVALEASVGDVVEIRRTPQLGQEVPVALGTILEVTERRVVVSVDQIYQLDIPPNISDVVYLEQE